MINYTKVRESVEKNSSKKSLGKGMAVNKSHTSSINLKLSQDIGIEQVKIPLKTFAKDNYEMIYSKQYQPLMHSQQKKYSVKLQSNQKENLYRKVVNHHYDHQNFMPLQENNRYLQTQRMPKNYKINNQRTPVKQPLRLRTDYQDQRERSMTPQKDVRQTVMRQPVLGDNKMVKIPAEDLKALMRELIKQQNQVLQLRRSVQFYRATAGKNTNNPVLRALKV